MSRGPRSARPARLPTGRPRPEPLDAFAPAREAPASFMREADAVSASRFRRSAEMAVSLISTAMPSPSSDAGSACGSSSCDRPLSSRGILRSWERSSGLPVWAWSGSSAWSPCRSELSSSRSSEVASLVAGICTARGPRTSRAARRISSSATAGRPASAAERRATRRAKSGARRLAMPKAAAVSQSAAIAASGTSTDDGEIDAFAAKREAPPGSLASAGRPRSSQRPSRSVRAAGGASSLVMPSSRAMTGWPSPSCSIRPAASVELIRSAPATIEAGRGACAASPA